MLALSVYITAAWITGTLGLTSTLILVAATLLSTRRTNKSLHTDHGKTIGEHVEDLVTWSHIHTEQDNEIRQHLGLPPAVYPDLTAWKNER